MGVLATASMFQVNSGVTARRGDNPRRVKGKPAYGLQMYGRRIAPRSSAFFISNG